MSRPVAAACLLVAIVSPALAETLRVPQQYPDIQTAINFAVDGDVIELDDGVYVGPGNKNLDTLGLAVTIRSRHGAESCVIDCERDGRAFRFVSGETAATSVAGISVAGGAAQFADGGAIEILEASPGVFDCRFLNNSALRGGAVRINGGAPKFVRCYFAGNTGTSQDGAGAVSAVGYSWTFESTVFTGNTGQTSAAGSLSNGTLRNCLFYGNIATRNGGRILSMSGVVMTNCTAVRNSTNLGSAIYAFESTSIKNCIVADNDGRSIEQNPLVTYSLIEGGYPGTHNIDGDPLFVSGLHGDFYLSCRRRQGINSPCVNAGDPTEPDWGYSLLTTRTDGKPDKRTVDMGYHYPRR